MTRPGGTIASRPLHFIWICDSSGSMRTEGKMQALNNAIREAIPHMRRMADENPYAEVLVRAIRFSTTASWHIPTPTPVTSFSWPDLTADGETALGGALTLLAAELTIPPMTERALPPVLVLVSDGLPTDDYQAGIAALLRSPWGRKASRQAIAIGPDVNFDLLSKFIAHPGITPLRADNPEALVRHIKWVSTAVLKSVSTPANRGETKDGAAEVTTPAEPADGTSDNVW